MYASLVLFILYSAFPSAVLLLAFFVMYFDSELELPSRFQIGGKTTLPFRKTWNQSKVTFQRVWTYSWNRNVELIWNWKIKEIGEHGNNATKPCEPGENPKEHHHSVQVEHDFNIFGPLVLNTISPRAREICQKKSIPGRTFCSVLFGCWSHHLAMAPG